MTPSLQSKLDEFKANIWNHSEDEFQLKFDERPPLSKKEITFLHKIISAIKMSDSLTKLGADLKKAIQEDPDLFVLLLQIAGLTRTKIITDLKPLTLSRKLSFQFPSSYKSLINHPQAWDLAGPYLAAKLKPILGKLSDGIGEETLEAISQATWPGFIRQERAKRSGHEGEFRLATLLFECGIPFEPVEKSTNPLCQDIQIHSVSFDVVIPNPVNPKICVKSTIHTSNIGQYGESKDHLEIEEARQMIDKKYQGKDKPILLALIDGIGFDSNRAGLEGVLTKSDEFCQFKTLWKVLVICSFLLKKKIHLLLSNESIKLHKSFLEKYANPNLTLTALVGEPPKTALLVGNGYYIL